MNTILIVGAVTCFGIALIVLSAVVVKLALSVIQHDRILLAALMAKNPNERSAIAYHLLKDRNEKVPKEDTGPRADDEVLRQGVVLTEGGEPGEG